MSLADCVEKNGKTIRENNSEKTHKYQVGDLVEIVKSGGRAFIVMQTRDCDGTLLYWLCLDKDDNIQEHPHFANRKWMGAYSEEGLKLIKRYKS